MSPLAKLGRNIQPSTLIQVGPLTIWVRNTKSDARKRYLRVCTLSYNAIKIRCKARNLILQNKHKALKWKIEYTNEAQKCVSSWELVVWSLE